MNYFIIGATGYIGSYLYNELQLTDNVAGTSRRKLSDELLYYDMSAEKLEFPTDLFAASTDKVAVVCSAISRLSDCHNNYKEAYRVNVTNTIATISWLVKCGYHVIFLSSDSVFDGKKGFYAESDTPNPINEYGRMKRDVELFLEVNYPEVCILRLSKVVGNNNFEQDLFRSWKEMALQGKTINCIKGNYITPVFIGDIVDKVRILAASRGKGGGI